MRYLQKRSMRDTLLSGSEVLQQNELILVKKAENEK